MDQFLQSMATTSATFVGKAAYSYAASLALKKIQSYSFQGERGTNLNNNKDNSSLQHDKEVLLKNYKVKLSRKLSVLLPVLDRVLFRIAKGYSLDEQANSIVSLSKELQENLEKLALYSQELAGRSSSESEQDDTKLQNQKRLEQFRVVLELIEEIIPLLQLFFSCAQWTLPSSAKVDTSSEHISISYSRLLKASSALVTGDATSTFKSMSSQEIQIGPSIPIRLYTLFQGSARKDADFTWKEEYYKGLCKIYRQLEPSLSNERKYTVLLEQDLNDSRFHEHVDPALMKTKSYIPGENRRFNVLDISKMYYTTSGSLLNIDGSTMPVLVFKVVRSGKIRENRKSSDTPKSSNTVVEWLALELFLETNESDSISTSSDSEDESEEEKVKNQITNDMTRISISTDPFDSKIDDGQRSNNTSLSQLCFLEYLVRLCIMESRQGVSHTNIPDFYFQEYFENEIVGVEKSGKMETKKGQSVETQEKVVMDSPSSRKLMGKHTGSLLDRFLGSGTGGLVAFLEDYFSQYSTWD